MIFAIFMQGLAILRSAMTGIRVEPSQPMSSCKRHIFSRIHFPKYIKMRNIFQYYIFSGFADFYNRKTVWEKNKQTKPKNNCLFLARVNTCSLKQICVNRFLRKGKIIWAYYYDQEMLQVVLVLVSEEIVTHSFFSDDNQGKNNTISISRKIF